ncbi:dynein axonemal heavy chain 3-like [Coregonus clupeaformis]|uniref:dynein axonemal heavy chain 3-like n=1 Tax=Coregonus clupeaformis TaxID=59861 RepID=UPI001E1C7E3D|nr:dynein axonemal heavy chain 3-like [Coregonus clupeaformis]
MFCLDVLSLNKDLCDRAEKLKDRLIVFEVDENRELNKSICHRYDEIAATITGAPGNTEELVALNQYLKHTSEVTVHKLKEEINEAANRLSFLLDYATLSHDDGREHAEDHLLKRIAEFDQMLQCVRKEVEAFKKKELMSLEEMKNNVEKLNELTSRLDAAVTELDDINKEESLLEKEQSQFPMLQTLMGNKQPYDQLWTNALNFQNKSEIWMNGPFLHLNAEKISEELVTMWRTVYKLTKSFSDLPGPRRVADSFKIKIDKFKQHLPILTTICNPGIKDRHWETISTIVGFDVKPDVDTSLFNMVELGLSKFSDKLEEIGASASKEYSLEKAMEKMKTEWAELHFAFTAYRDTVGQNSHQNKQLLH